MPAHQVEDALNRINENIHSACKRAGRPPNNVALLPVSKGQSVSLIQSALNITGFPKMLGENYFDEFKEKQSLIQGPIEWHFIGTIQSRKLVDILKTANVIQSVAREKELQIIKKNLTPTFKGFFLQINISSEAQKNGLDPAHLKKTLDVIATLGLETHLLGLMALPSSPDVSSEQQIRKEYAVLRELRDALLPGKKISVGMSHDYIWAIEEGSDLVRIGSLLFGERHS